MSSVVLSTVCLSLFLLSPSPQWTTGRQDLEQSALDTHARTEALGLNPRLAQDEALRAKNYLERGRINPEDKASGLDYIQSKLSSLHSQLSLVSQEGAPPSSAAAMAISVTLNKRSSCPAELNHDPQ
ncbi:hypothetical protein lerEdw1_006496 [Lerista edwardsae]|nr:hypothetical protein lerEdw1_006496 [Lerista edwardsae]